MAQFKLYLADAIFSTIINEKWHNLNEKWHNSNYIWQTQYFQPKSMKNDTFLMKNGTVQSRVKINLGVVHILRNHGWGGWSLQMITVLQRRGGDLAK